MLATGQFLKGRDLHKADCESCQNDGTLAPANLNASDQQERNGPDHKFNYDANCFDCNPANMLYKVLEGGV